MNILTNETVCWEHICTVYPRTPGEQGYWRMITRTGACGSLQLKGGTNQKNGICPEFTPVPGGSSVTVLAGSTRSSITSEWSLSALRMRGSQVSRATQRRPVNPAYWISLPIWGAACLPHLTSPCSVASSQSQSGLTPQKTLDGLIYVCFCSLILYTFNNYTVPSPSSSAGNSACNLLQPWTRPIRCVPYLRYFISHIRDRTNI